MALFLWSRDGEAVERATNADDLLSCDVMLISMAKATVRVLLFGRLREECGWHEQLVELPQPRTTVARLQQDPGIHCPGLRWAVNQDFAPPDHPLQPGDELAFLPPITGG